MSYLPNDLPQTSTDWLEWHKKYRLNTRYTSPVVLERGEGLRLWDVDGHEYLDFHSGQVCASIGHANPEFAEAVSAQLRTLVQTGSIFTVPAEILVAKKLAEITPPRFTKSVFACSGSEAVEISLRMSKFATGRFEVITVLGGYHGLTAGSFFSSSAPGFRRGQYGAGFPGVVQIPMPNEYRCEFGCGGTCNLACAHQGRRQIEMATSGEPAALLTEFLFSAGGVVVPPAQWIEEIRKIADDFGMLLIADEAQTGLGRTGEWFAFEHYTVEPDLVIVSKTLGGGIPLSVVIVSDQVAATLESKKFFYTSSHSGDPLLAAAGLATLSILEKDNLVQNAREMGAYLKAALDDFKRRFEIVGDVRGLGLKLGMEFVEDKVSKKRSPRATREFVTRCLAKGLILGTNPEATSNIIRFLPGFGITRMQADKGLAIMEEALVETTRLLDGKGAGSKRPVAVSAAAR
jgi:4-aminobutyrate aminotransferase-like enzyme